MLLTAGGTPPAGRGLVLFQGVDPGGSEDNSIFVADADGGHPREILGAVDGDLLHPDWAADGRAIAYSIGGASIHVATAAGTQDRLVVGCSTACSGVDFPAWSPDGRSLAYTRYVEPGTAGPPASSVIVVQDIASGAERVVARSDPGQLVDVPRWSGDGKRLVIGIDRFDDQGAETGSAIAVVDVRSATLRRITSFQLYAYAPDWNRRSGEIVFSLETARYAAEPASGPLDLYGIRPDGSGLRRITHVRGDRVVWQPAFTPDGGSIVATLDEPGGRRGVRVDLRTGVLQRLGTASLVMNHLKARP